MNLLGAIVLDCDVFFSESCVWTLVLQLIALFENIVEPLGDGASLEELGHWEQTWGLDSSASFPVHFLHLECRYYTASQFPVPTQRLPSSVVLPSSVHQNKLFLPFTHRVFYHFNWKKKITTVPQSKFPYTAQLGCGKVILSNRGLWFSRTLLFLLD